tara:strand:+ start:1618 stop:2214 length:597 start_codon:yes stop_codon:yes gene_type:complete
MSFRIEEKLYIRSESILDFKEFLVKSAAKQLYKPRSIKSLYFDNLNFDMYKDSIEGVVPRKKIRIREYPGTSDKKLYLEIKNSSVEGRFKTRKILDSKKIDYHKRSGFFDNQYGVCLPNFYVTYIREYSMIEDVRISIDKNLEYKSYRTNNIYKDSNSIVEIKTSIKKNLDDLIKLFPFQRIRFSKYCFAVDNLKNVS